MSDFTPSASSTSAYTPSTESSAMDFSIMGRARKQGDHSGYLNGMGVGLNGIDWNRIPHTPEKELANGANWVVQKFGGTSVGKFGRVIGEDIVAYVSYLYSIWLVKGASRWSG